MKEKKDTTKKKKKSNEESDEPKSEYQKLTQIEHALHRPDTYIGPIEKEVVNVWVVGKDGKMELKDLNFVPGLFKIFDEILVNAADNKQRDKSMNLLKVELNQEEGFISVFNNGAGIPVEKHPKEKIYIPELIFGHLLTSSNYDDSKKRTTGGRNGYGAKLTNIFSTKFIIECQDSKNDLFYKQVWRDNMSVMEKAEITQSKEKSFTKVTFYPDFKRFKMQSFENDIFEVMKKRVYDIAGTSDKSLKVYLNGERLQVGGFKEYCEMYLSESSEFIYEKINDRWEFGVSVTDGHFQQISFVNSICTSKGGQHVTYVCDQLVKAIVAQVEKKNKGLEVKPFHVKNHLFLFVNALIENPAFDSQTKETLTSKKSTFGSTCELSEKLLKKVLKCGIVDIVTTFSKLKSTKLLKKTDGKKTSRVFIPKLDDANDAGGRYSSECTLILTEGDSAKALAVSGLSVVGRDRYGVFPLKGKLVNPRDSSSAMILKNAEFANIKQILGLQNDKEYKDTTRLRYGHIMIMADQDHDGSHIKGLIINLFAFFWPSLLKCGGFLSEFITPIVKVVKKTTKKSKKKPECIAFYTIPEYQKWKKENNDGKGWEIKYYKGLGTNKSAEAKEYFSDLERHQIDFENMEDKDAKAIEKAFAKRQADTRKKWIAEYKPGTHIDHDIESLTLSEFVDKELILFSIESNKRSIPSLVDGFKPSQRKILYCCFKKNVFKDIKVASLSGYIIDKGAYHHGETSLNETIVKMAQNFVGTNNINLLYPSGVFGTRSQGGQDAASARYIFTRLNPIARAIFHEKDDAILNYLNEDGQMIEPTWYVPVIPMVLVNGGSGIGTGWSTCVPNYNPRDIVRNLKHLLKKEELEELHPWYKGFTGTITVKVGKKRTKGTTAKKKTTKTKTKTKSKTKSKEGGEEVEQKDDEEGLKFKDSDDEEEEEGEEKNESDASIKYTVKGILTNTDETSYRITELPLERWTTPYKHHLEGLIEKGVVQSYKEYHTEDTVDFRLKVNADAIKDKTESELMKMFKLATSITTSNMVLFDANGQIKKYKSANEILREFFTLRMEYYVKRKAFIVDQLSQELCKLDNRARFILAVINEELVIRNVKKAVILSELKRQKYDLFPKQKKKKVKKEDEAENEDEEEENEEKYESKEIKNDEMRKLANGYDYLLSMPLWSLTLEMVEELKKKRDSKQAELNVAKATTETDMWISDLDEFLRVLDEHEAMEKEEKERTDSGAKKVGRGGGRRRGRGRGRGGRGAKRAASSRGRKKELDNDDDNDDKDSDYDEKEEKKSRSRANSTKPRQKKIKDFYEEKKEPKGEKDSKKKVADTNDESEEKKSKGKGRGKGTTSKSERGRGRGRGAAKSGRKKKSDDDEDFEEKDDSVDKVEANSITSTRPSRRIKKVNYAGADDSLLDESIDVLSCDEEEDSEPKKEKVKVKEKEKEKEQKVKKEEEVKHVEEAENDKEDLILPLSVRLRDRLAGISENKDDEPIEIGKDKTSKTSKRKKEQESPASSPIKSKLKRQRITKEEDDTVASDASSPVEPSNDDPPPSRQLRAKRTVNYAEKDDNDENDDDDVEEIDEVDEL